MGPHLSIPVRSNDGGPAETGSLREFAFDTAAAQGALGGDCARQCNKAGSGIGLGRGLDPTPARKRNLGHPDPTKAPNSS